MERQRAGQKAAANSEKNTIVKTSAPRTRCSLSLFNVCTLQRMQLRRHHTPILLAQGLFFRQKSATKTMWQQQTAFRYSPQRLHPNRLFSTLYFNLARGIRCDQAIPLAIRILPSVHGSYRKFLHARVEKKI